MDIIIGFVFLVILLVGSYMLWLAIVSTLADCGLVWAKNYMREHNSRTGSDL